MSEVKDLDVGLIAESFTGVVVNESTNAYFVLQRQVPPGGKVSLGAAYLDVGLRSGETDESAFACWLQESVLLRGSWGYYDQEGNSLTGKKTAVAVDAEEDSVDKTPSGREKGARGAGKVLRRSLKDAKGVEITPKEIIEAPYEEARTLIEKSKDRVVLKKALALTKHFSGKEQHMRHLMRRIEQVY